MMILILLFFVNTSLMAEGLDLPKECKVLEQSRYLSTFECSKPVLFKGFFLRKISLYKSKKISPKSLIQSTLDIKGVYGDFVFPKNSEIRFRKGEIVSVRVLEAGGLFLKKFKLKVGAKVNFVDKDEFSFWLGNDVEHNGVQRPWNTFVIWRKGEIVTSGDKVKDKKVFRFKKEDIEDFASNTKVGFIEFARTRNSLLIDGIKWKAGTELYRVVYPNNEVGLKAARLVKGQVYKNITAKEDLDILEFCWDTKKKKIRQYRFITKLDRDVIKYNEGVDLEKYLTCDK